MALAYQVSCPPGTKTLLADKTLGGGNHVTIQNTHATETLVLGGDENELATGGGSTLTTANGFRLIAGASLTTVLVGNEQIWGRSGTTTVTVTAAVFRRQVLSLP